jgi:endothelin-converting enzyme/putative endopeptidase
MRATLLCLLVLASCAFSQQPQQETPLHSLPYTPSLDSRFMDRSADPCTDFYKYACGNWTKLNPLPADQDSWDVYRKLTDENQRFLWGILETAAKPSPSRTANEQKIGDYFGACMNEADVEKAGADPLDPALARIAKLRGPEDIAAYVAMQHHGIGDGVLFGYGSGQDYDDSSRVITFADAGGLGLPDRDYYTKTDIKSAQIRKRYVEHVATMLGLIGESAPEARIDAETVVAIETALAQASLTRVEQRDPYNLKHKMTHADLDHLTPAFNWDAYIKDVSAPEFEQVNVTQPKFFTEMNTLLSQRKTADWRAYFRWHLVHSHAPYLSANFVREDFEFYGKYLAGRQQMSPRWKRCTRLVDRDLGEALGQVFVAKTFSPETKEHAQQLARQIETEMGNDIKQLDWMSDATKVKALEKLHAVVNKIGYPDRWRDYSSVTIVPSSFYADAEQARAFEVRRDLAKIGKPVDRGEWQMTPPTVNAYYDPQMNDINFPAGVLQPPLYDPKMDDAPNYGNTGATVGHELTHGFDDEGRQFDAHGNLKDWWTDSDAKAFENRVSCVRDQYAQYTIIDDIKINSKLTLGEDVADLGGTLLAYLAWKHETAGQDLKPLEDLSPDQRFFVGMAQWACGETRPESKRMHAITDPHSPDEFRINGVVSDLPEFGKAFGCKVGQPMMRANACRVW